MNDQVREVIQRPRTLNAFVPGWVIGDGSFPRAAVGNESRRVINSLFSWRYAFGV